MFSTVVNFFRYQRVIRDVIRNTDFVKALSTSFGIQFKYDRLYRLYAVINPYVQNFGTNEDGIVYSEDKPIVDKWVVDNFIVIDMMIKNHNLFDILSYEITKLDDDMNYLLVVHNTLLEPMKRVVKRTGLVILGIVLTIIIYNLIF